MNIAHWLARSAQLHAERPAIAHGQSIWCTYAEFGERAAKVATWLMRQGVVEGDRVALFMHNRPDYLELQWGVWWVGAVVVPINSKLHPREAAWIVQHADAKLVFTDESMLSELETALAELGHVARIGCETGFSLDESLPLAKLAERQEDDPCWLFYTSGTTGRPKGVILGARQLRWMSLAYLAEIDTVIPGDVMLHPAPMSHGGGMYHLPYVLQGGLNVVPQSGGFDSVECLLLAAHWQRTSFFAAPTMVRRLVDTVKQSGRPAKGLSTIVYGGGPMYLTDIQEALQVIGPHFAQIYGQGECPMTITAQPKHIINDTQQPRHLQRLASVGRAQSMVELSIRDANGQVLPVGERGEVCVRGEVVMSGYWRDESATSAAMHNGWLATGDVGRLDAEGFLTLLDRSKDLVVSGGTNIYPREVEEALLSHPDVAEVSVIGRSDKEWGEVVVAYVVPRRSLDAATLDAHCLEHIARFKRPKHYCFVEVLPKNNYGKVLKTTLRELDATRAQGV